MVHLLFSGFILDVALKREKRKDALLPHPHPTLTVAITVPPQYHHTSKTFLLVAIFVVAQWLTTSSRASSVIMPSPDTKECGKAVIDMIHGVGPHLPPHGSFQNGGCCSLHSGWMLLRWQCGLLAEIRWRQCEANAETVACSKTMIALVEDGDCVGAMDLVRWRRMGCRSGSREVLTTP